MYCHKCHTKIANGAKFCSNCGSKTNLKTLCSNCGNENEEGAKFCGICGNQLQSYTQVDNNISNTTLNEQSDSTKRRVYKGKASSMDAAADIIRNVLVLEKLEYQIHKEIETIIIQGRKKSSLFNKALGLDMAATIKIEKQDQDLIIHIGGGKWMDKLGGGAIAWFVFWPALLTTGWGIYLQQTLFKKIDNQLLSYLT